ncbi:kinesin-like protein, partial [Kipferlia bialata]
DAVEHLFSGETARVVAEHRLNRTSSRSHCIFTLHLEQRSRVAEESHITRSKLHLVDLAGSERVGKTGSDGQVLKEANYINRSLSFLEQCVIALSDPQRGHIPYRSSKLTTFLRDSLGGNSRTVMVANIIPVPEYIVETVSTLRFAKRVMCIENEFHVNREVDPVLRLKELEKEIVALKKDIQFMQGNNGADALDTDTVHSLVNAYISEGGDDTDATLDISAYRNILDAFSYMRRLVRQGGGVATKGGDLAGATPDVTESMAGIPSGTGAEEGAGDILEGTGAFVAGLAPEYMQPSDTLPGTPSVQRKGSMLGGGTPSMRGHGTMRPAPNGTDLSRLSDDEVYALYREGPGVEYDNAVTENKAASKQCKAKVRSLATSVNDTKRRIDECLRLVGDGEAEREGGMDQGQIEALEELSGLRDTYRGLYADLKQARTEQDVVKQSLSQARQQLLTSFEQWRSESMRVNGVLQDGLVASDSVEAYTFALKRTGKSLLKRR